MIPLRCAGLYGSTQASLGPAKMFSPCFQGGIGGMASAGLPAAADAAGAGASVAGAADCVAALADVDAGGAGDTQPAASANAGTRKERDLVDIFTPPRTDRLTRKREPRQGQPWP